MKIYRYLVPTDEFKNTILFQPGKLYLRLNGINISEKEVEPIYRPLLTFERIGGYLLLGVSLFGINTILVLSFHKPFIHIERIRQEDDEFLDRS